MRLFARALLAAGLIAPVMAGAQMATVGGTVFVDANANGVRDIGEKGVAHAVVSNQDTVVVTDANGSYHLPIGTTGVVSISVPAGYTAVGAFWRPAVTATAIDFPLRPVARGETFTFIHASDTHIAPAAVARTERFRAIVDSVKPDFVIVTGDLVKDALRVSEPEATSYYDLFQEQAKQFTVPLWTVPGNHENFGIERDKSGVRADHPLYGRAMYRKYRGPDYYSFNFGGIHFVGLNSVDIEDQSYYGHIDSVQVAWLKRDLAQIPPAMPVVTFNHIPFFTAMESMNGYTDNPPAPTLIAIRGKTQFRHTVSNAKEILGIIGMSRYPIALGGHMHVREQLRYAGVPTRFDQTAAVVGPAGGGVMAMPSGITLYRVRAGKIDDGTFIPMGIDRK